MATSESGDVETVPLSKNKLKKLKRDQEWEENRAKRKAKRKEKVQEKKQRRRAVRENANPANSAQTNSILEDQGGAIKGPSRKSRRPQNHQLPITLVLDCGFDDLMMDKERKSLGSQVTRCYSDNHKALYQAHLTVSSFGGHLKERFDGLLAGHHHSWRNVRFLEGDFVEAARQANEWMRGDHGGKLAGMLANKDSSDKPSEDRSELGEVIYLTSDSPNTLTELRPYSTYIIGGLVDRNRYKGVCYKKAMDRGIKTAKLPIGDYMQMSSRFVLATNHVVEIMLRWLELGDWGKAFLQVMPKRKGGILKDTAGEANGEEADEEAYGEEDERIGGRPPLVANDEASVRDRGSPLLASGTMGEDRTVDGATAEEVAEMEGAEHDVEERNDSNSGSGGVQIQQSSSSATSLHLP